ncbi:MAG TPA: PPOX class F420-dependent oxidoreductase [Phototrophicaceae bacterium]|jgi:PPOX class probable F420-dependent enzyme|nr:PPOX class F420-dependent oxidoreductase [Phototrophicaceae bacterium]
MSTSTPSTPTASIPESHRDLIERPVYVVLTTMMPDGQPQSTIVWWDGDGEYVRVNTALQRQKAKNMARNTRVTILAMDNHARWLEVRGVVEEITQEGALEHIDKLSHKYAGKPYYGDGGMNPIEQKDRETRVMVKIRPTKVLAFPPKRG